MNRIFIGHINLVTGYLFWLQRLVHIHVVEDLHLS